MPSSWRDRAATVFSCEKQPAQGTRGMVVTNHPLASAAGAEMLAAGGNAIDAAIACHFALSVVEPMMSGPLGGGLAHIRLADGSHRVVDAMSTVASSGSAAMYRPVPDGAPENYEVLDRENTVGPKAVATPGALRGWCEALASFGTMALADVMAPAIRHAERGFFVTDYLSECIGDAAADLARDPVIAGKLLPGGLKLNKGDRLINGAYADALRLIAREGAAALHGGPLGEAAADCIQKGGGFVTRGDIAGYRTQIRAPVRGPYRGFEIVVPPPPSAALHILQMLNILEGFDVGGLGFGSAANVHLLAEALKIAFADRAVASGDPDFMIVPVETLISKPYAALRRGEISLDATKAWGAGVSPGQSPHTTHVTVADAMGNVVASTQTINSTFGARFMVPETGMIANNYMNNFDPRPGTALSIAPGKRVTTSMAPAMVLKDGVVRAALGLPGGKRIFPSVMQAIVNLIDHGMTAQEAVEAPRVWTEGPVLEVEDAYAERVLRALRGMGHTVKLSPHVAGGMSCISFGDDGVMTGAACWRADGTAIGLGGGLARPNVRFWPDMIPV
jgi:gamma-glutamyltranspeptidase/glutathione hydrolase